MDEGIGDNTIADAFLDRPVYTACLIDLKGVSEYCSVRLFSPVSSLA
jgi:hypothetical protein